MFKCKGMMQNPSVLSGCLPYLPLLKGEQSQPYEDKRLLRHFIPRNDEKGDGEEWIQTYLTVTYVPNLVAL